MNIIISEQLQWTPGESHGYACICRM